METTIKRDGGHSFDAGYVAGHTLEAWLEKGTTHFFQNLVPEKRQAAMISIWEEATGEIVAVVTEQTLIDNPVMVDQGAQVGDLFSYKAHATPEESLAQSEAMGTPPDAEDTDSTVSAKKSVPEKSTAPTPPKRSRKNSK